MIVFGVVSLALGRTLPLVPAPRRRPARSSFVHPLPGFGCSSSSQQRRDLFMGLHDVVQV
jgi:hypothetical protein